MHGIERFLQDFHKDFELLKVSCEFPVGGAIRQSKGYLFSLPCRDSATAAAMRFFHHVILSVVEIRAKRGSNGMKCHSGSRWKKFDSAYASLRMTRQELLARWVSHFAKLSERVKYWRVMAILPHSLSCSLKLAF